MRMIRVFLILTAVLCLLTTCCDDCKDCPVCPEPEPEEHLFYIMFMDPYGVCYVKPFSVEQNDFIDSIGTDQRVVSMDIAGDNEYLLLSGMGGFEQIDLKTKEVVYENPAWGMIVEVSPDSRYFRVFDAGGKSHEIRRISDRSLVFRDTLPGMGGFSQDSRFYAYPRDIQDGTGLSELMIYDIPGDSVINKGIMHYWGDVPLYLLVVDIDSRNNKVFFAGSPGQALFLFSYDLENDVVNVVMPVPSGGLIFQLDPNLDILYVTSLSHPPPGAIGDDSLYMFNTNTDDLIYTIATTTVTWHHAPYCIAVSNDSRYICTSTLNYHDEGFVVYDALYRVPLTYVRIPTHTALYACTKK